MRGDSSSEGDEDDCGKEKRELSREKENESEYTEQNRKMQMFREMCGGVGAVKEMKMTVRDRGKE